MVHYNVAISGWAKQGRAGEAVQAFQEIAQQNLEPTVVSSGPNSHELSEI